MNRHYVDRSKSRLGRAGLLAAVILFGLITSCGITMAQTPSVPVLISPSDGSSTEANFPKFAWSSSIGAIGYALQVAANSDFDYPIVEKYLYADTVYDSSLIPNGTYYWRVAASGSGETWSGWSSVSEFGITGPYEVPSEFPDIRAAIDAIPYYVSSEVLVAPGTYMGHGNCNLDVFYSKSVQLRSSGGPYSTFIDCGDSLRGLYFEPETGPGTVVEGFTIRNATGYEGTGGAIDCFSTPVTINNCIIENCSNGGVFIRGWGWSHATITDCIIKNNNWRGVSTSDGISATITGCTFQDNTGYGLYLNADSNTVVTNCDFINNQGHEGDGCGAYVYNSAPTFQLCNFLQNEGVGLYCWNSNLSMDNCTFTGNYNWWKGSGIHARNGSLITLTNSTFDGNTAWYGAGIFLEDATANLAQCLFDGNTAQTYGGGLYVNDLATFSATGCTFVNNSAPTGSAIYIEPDPNAPESDGNDITVRPARPGDMSLGGAMVSECLFAYNQQSAPVHLEPYAWIEIMCSDIYGNTGGDWVGRIAPYLGQDGNISANPLFCDAANDNYSVTANSPVADANTSCATIGAFDVGCGAIELSLTPTSFEFAAASNNPNPAAQNLQINNLGGNVLNWTLSENSSWINVNASGGTAPSTVSISIDKTGLPGGVYNDNLVIYGDNCINSPQVVPVTLTITTGKIAVTPTFLDFEMTYGDLLPPEPQTLTVSNSGGGSLSCQLSNGQTWLQLSPIEFSTPQSVTVSVAPAGLSPGTYEDTIVIVSEDALNSPRFVPVTLTITAGEIVVTPTFLDFEMTYGDLQPPESQTLTVSNSGDGSLSCQLSNGQTWLQLSPTQFSAPQNVTVSVAPGGLSPGTYEDTIVIVSVNALNSPQYVGVTLNITDVAPPTLWVGGSTHPITGTDPLMVAVNVGDNLGITFEGTSPLPEVVTTLSISNQPSGSLFDSVSEGISRFEWSPVPQLVGTYYITVTADDGYQTSSLVVGIDINQGPSFTSVCGDVSLEEAQPFYCHLVAQDANGDSLIITWDSIPLEAEFTDNGDGTADFTFEPDYRHVDETFNVTFEVTDGLVQVTNALTIDVYNRQLQVEAMTGEEDDLLITESILIEFNEPVQPDSLDKYLEWSSALAAGLHYQYDATNHFITVSAASGDLTPLDTILITLEVGLCDLAYHPLEQEYQQEFTIGPVVYPGDANNDGIVDERDVLPLGLYWGNEGPSRAANTDMAWVLSPARVNYNDSSWSPVRVVYCDADGSGLIEANDICGITENWTMTHTIAEDGKNDGGASLVTSLGMVEESVLQALYQAILTCPESQGRNALRESMEALLDYQPSESSTLPTTVELYQNYPNPFNPFTTIRFYLPSGGRATLSIYNMLGQRVATLIDGHVNAGYMEATWDATNATGHEVASGIYFYRLETTDFSDTQRMMLLK